jgi:hypothetical protein
MEENYGNSLKTQKLKVIQKACYHFKLKLSVKLFLRKQNPVTRYQVSEFPDGSG